MFVVLALLVLATQAAEPLFLTNYLDNPALGQSLSKVTAIPYGPGSWSGYFTVGENPFRNTFFWFFASENKDPNTPVMVWLQGGPGGSSM